MGPSSEFACLNFSKIFILTLSVTISFVLISTKWFVAIQIPEEENGESAIKLIVAGAILVILYVMIILEIVERTLAVLIGAAISIAAHVYLNGSVSMGQVVGWLDLETLSLLFGMMILSSILSLSGLLDFAAIWFYNKSSGRFWLLITSLSLVTAMLSALIDNVTIMLLLTPTLIKLSHLEQLDPRYILMIMVMMSNMGGGATPVGDPPNLIIISDPLATKLNITFGSFVLYATPGILICVATILLYLKLVYKSREAFASMNLKGSGKEFESNNETISDLQTSQFSNKPSSIVENEAELLGESKLFGGKLYQISDKLASTQLSGYPKENINQQIEEISKDLEIKFSPNSSRANNNYGCSNQDNDADGASKDRHESTVSIDMVRHPERTTIRSKTILVQSLVVLLIAAVLFVIHPSIVNTSMSLGSISLFSSLVLLVLTSTSRVPKTNNLERKDQSILEYAIEHVEWSTLIFFSGLFIIMEVVSQLGLISFLGVKIGQFIGLLPEGALKSIGAISVVLWSSGIASAFVDNVPITSMLIKILGAMSSSSAGMNLNIKSLLFALVFGVCCGGNGTLIGASSNLVTSGISATHGIPISYNRFLKFCSPVAILTTIVINIYLVVVFVVLEL